MNDLLNLQALLVSANFTFITFSINKLGDALQIRFTYSAVPHQRQGFDLAIKDPEEMLVDCHEAIAKLKLSIQIKGRR
tara:strand:- start:9377 stop:9610 length:234 start_codon:yes stop_codon:yes gene_type:complete